MLKFLASWELYSEDSKIHVFLPAFPILLNLLDVGW